MIGVIRKAGRSGTVMDWYGRRIRAGDRGGKKYQQTVSVSCVCVGARAFIQGGVGAKDRGWYV